MYTLSDWKSPKYNIYLTILVFLQHTAITHIINFIYAFQNHESYLTKIESLEQLYKNNVDYCQFVSI